jgi:hypothetical protein
MLARAQAQGIEVHPETKKRAILYILILLSFGTIQMFVDPTGMIGIEVQGTDSVMQVMFEQDKIYITLGRKGIEEVLGFEVTPESPSSLETFLRTFPELSL